ncbi:PTS sugar transporter subunit IIC, partial [Escherichia coli]|uniref:PTS sugar transporter subunit IIC n=1 Tax=Escherichia coli TaxID=562 RepID=UPI0020254AD2
QSIGAGIALAIPLAAAGQVLTIIVRTITVAFQHAADKADDNGNLTASSWNQVSSLFLQAMRVDIPAVIVELSVVTGVCQQKRKEGGGGGGGGGGRGGGGGG